MPGDQLDVFGDPLTAATGWCRRWRPTTSCPRARDSHRQVQVSIPADARRGQTISVILQGADDGQFPLTRYDRVTITVS